MLLTVYKHYNNNDSNVQIISPYGSINELNLGSGLAAFTSNSAFAQNYGYADNSSYGDSYSGSSYGDSNSYSKYPTDDKKYECRTGPFEGFFVSSVEFCKHIKFDDKNRKDTRDNRTGTQGPPGPPGPASTIPGPQGPAGLSTINTTNIYTNVGLTASGNITGPAFL